MSDFFYNILINIICGLIANWLFVHFCLPKIIKNINDYIDKKHLEALKNTDPSEIKTNSSTITVESINELKEKGLFKSIREQMSTPKDGFLFKLRKILRRRIFKNDSLS